jgi:hypothetical protein
MTLVLDERANLKDGPGFHALIAGVSAYPHLIGVGGHQVVIRYLETAPPVELIVPVEPPEAFSETVVEVFDEQDAPCQAQAGQNQSH